jgi:hypothetical protein
MGETTPESPQGTAAAVSALRGVRQGKPTTSVSVCSSPLNALPSVTYLGSARPSVTAVAIRTPAP